MTEAEPRFRIVEFIGRGGMGEVCLADDVLLDRRVAVKFLTESTEQEASGQLLAEARAAGALDHPFICKIFEITTLSGRPCIVMEYVRGETIERRLRRGPLALGDALRLADEMAEALEAAHTRRVIHRDLKPANVIITADRHIKVMDFGLAARLPAAGIEADGASLQGTGTEPLRGTPAYMAPEQILGGAPDRRSDIFSFGVLLYEMVSGMHPFLRSGLDATLAAILSEPSRDLHVLVPGVPKSVSAMVARMLVRSPDGRYQSFGDIRLDLRRIAAAIEPLSSELRHPVPVVASPAARAVPGREAELEDLLAAIRRTVAGTGGLVVLRGDTGVGKSCLAEEALARATRLGCQPLVGRCHEEDGTPPLSPYVEMLEDAARTMPAPVFGEAVGRSAPELARLLPDLRRLFPDMPAALELPPELQQRFLFANVQEFLTRASRVAPVVVVLDDFQWADESTLRLTQHLAPHLAGLPILFIIALRDAEPEPARPRAGALHQLLLRIGLRSAGTAAQPEAATRVVEQLASQRLARTMRVSPLPHATVGTILATLGGSRPPEPLVRQFFEQTEGNPFFIEELFRHMKEEGRLFDTRGQWRRDSDFSDIKVPPSLRTLFDRRLQAISAGTREVLATAALFGRPFDPDLLEAVAETRSEEVVAALDEAERAHILRGPSGRQEPRWRFAHPLLGRVLASTIPASAQQRLHAKIADGIVRLGARSPAYAADLAHHLYCAGPAAEAGRTAQALVDAGDAARSVYATGEALLHYTRALDVLAGGAGMHSLRAGVEERLGDLLALTGEHAQAMVHYESLMRARESAGNRPYEARILRKTGTLHWRAGNRSQAIAMYQRALALLEGTDAHLESAHLSQELGLAAFRSGDNARAVEWAERALGAAEAALVSESGAEPAIRREAAATIAHATNTIGVALARSGLLGEARERIERSVEAARQHELLDVACRGYANLGVLYSTVEPQRAIDVSLTGLELASRIGAASLQSYIYANLASAYCALTEQCETEGLVAATTAINLDRELGQLDHLAVPLIVMAQIHQCHGRLDEAQEVYREALALAEKIGEPQLMLPCYDGLATIALDRGDRVRAEQLLQKGRDLCEQAGLDPDALLLLPFLC